MVNIEASTQLELLERPFAPSSKTQQKVGKTRKKKFDFPPLGICSKNSFSNFLEGSSNSAAIKIAKRVIARPGEEFPLVFFVGESGLGKTHLLHAIYAELLGRKGLYLGTAKAFLDYFQIKCRNHGFAKFLTDFVDNVDVLLLDDIEDAFISKDFQNDFCHIYNHFNFRKKQIILSGHFSPVDLKGVFPKFQSRLNGGLVQEIHSMDKELGLSFLTRKAQEEGIALDEKSKKIILKGPSLDGRSIESALLKYKAREILEVPKSEVSFPHEVVENVCLKFKIGSGNIYSNSRRKQFIMARHVSMFLLSKGLGLSFFRIGKIFKRDHSSVLYAVGKIEQSLDEELKVACERVKNKKLPWPDSADYNLNP
jgi:chromosomal replication initiator protein